MPVERSGEQITIRTETGSMAVAPMKMVKNGVTEEAFRAWQDECAKRITPDARPADGLEAHLTGLCDLEPLPADHPQIRLFLQSLVKKHFEDRLTHRPPRFSSSMTDEELENWKRETEAQRGEIDGIPPERFGLRVRGFHILPTAKSGPFIEADRREWWERWGSEHCGDRKQAAGAEPEGYVCYEETTGEGSGSGFGGGALMREAVLYLGVTGEDIRNRTPRFFAYAAALAEKGDLPSLSEFIGGGA